MNKIIIKESMPIAYTIFYMSYAFMLGVGLTGWYIYKYSGVFPPPGSFFKFIEDSWPLISPLVSSPILLKISTKYLEFKKNKKLEETQHRRLTDRSK